MITIPLSTVVSYLTRNGVDLACLEGAPIVVPGFDGLHAFTPEAMSVGDIIELYLGRDAVCPAAMGWAAAVLGAGRAIPRSSAGVDSDRVHLFRACLDKCNHTWSWDHAIQEVEEMPDRIYLPGAPPPTSAARLLAVLDYEMGRDQP